MNTTTNLRSNRNYMLLLTAAILVSPGYYIYIVAVEWLTVTLFDSRSYLGLILFSSSGARLLFMIYGGIIADRVNRKIIILSSQWMKVLSIGVLLTMYWLDMITPLFLIIVSFLFVCWMHLLARPMTLLLRQSLIKRLTREATCCFVWLISTV
ncbi:MFS transporter [Paenibacillus popilliae]|nr:MFS transporter [Paenibacillus sp. SDF0028]